MDIDWLNAEYPVAVVGRAPDGGLFVHASLHPRGAEEALARASQAGVQSRHHAGEIYFPLPWIRSELASVVKCSSALGVCEVVAKPWQTLFVALPALQNHADSTRTFDRLCEERA